MPIRSWAAALAIAPLAAGCVLFSGMSAQDCRRADWEALGESEGGLGLQPQIDIYLHQCAGHGVAASREAYMKGWRVGIAQHSGRDQGVE